MLQRRRWGVQRLCLYVIPAAIMAYSIFHATVASFAEFCVSRAATSIYESHDHWFCKAWPWDHRGLNCSNLCHSMRSRRVTSIFKIHATYARAVGQEWVFIHFYPACLPLLSLKFLPIPSSYSFFFSKKVKLSLFLTCHRLYWDFPERVSPLRLFLSQPILTVARVLLSVVWLWGIPCTSCVCDDE